MSNVFDCKFNSGEWKIPEDMNTFAKLLFKQARIYKNRRFLGTREFLVNGQRGAYEWYSYSDIANLVYCFARGLQKLGFKRGDKAGIIAPNRTEWTVIDFACASIGMVLVPIYDTQSAEDIKYVCGDAGLVTCFSSLDKLDKIKPIKDQFSSIVVFDDRLDDRAVIKRSNVIHTPSTVPVQPRNQQIFDEFDKLEGIFDPAKNKYSEAVIHNSLCNGVFAYDVTDSEAKILQKSFKTIPEVFGTHTFWGIIDLGLNGEDFNQIKVPEEFINESTPDSLLSLVYTSGTTGKPKGVILKQSNVLWTGFVMPHSRIIPEKNPKNSLGEPMLRRQEYEISYLPLAHIYMRALQLVTINDAGCLGYWQGSTTGLLSDVKELRITNFFLVPRIIQKIVEGITSKVESGSKVQQLVFQKMYDIRQAHLRKMQTKYNLTLWDILHGAADKLAELPYEMTGLEATSELRRINFPKYTNLVFNQFNEMLGNRCRLCVTGSAPLSQQHGEFLVICFNVHIFEGFGMSETSAHGGVQTIHTMNFGSIGESLDKNTMLRIKSVPEMGYTIADKRILDYGGKQENLVCPRGELMIKGPSVFSGYYNDEEKTKESFEDGWFLTGDIAEYNPFTKEVKLIDRKRGIIKLSQGEFISVNQIEDAISLSRCVEQVFLYANRFQPIVTAVIIPNRSYLKTKGVSGEDMSLSQEAIAYVTEDIKKTCKAHNLRSFEIPKAVVIENEPWTPENGLLTPALKVKRPACKEKYEKLMLDIIKRITRLEGATMDKIAAEVVDALTNPQSESVSQKASSYSGMR
ncbi:Long_chain fatty acid CoA ligase [Hexamita inflata]|uniref:Long chain fatty acid CoA ligase n=1 Tax=Hexamita inflata TaxID=28002 RepID=A0AA86UIL9_9EUKA|nr:Long chain fatty acid CoA ligase [Hexamita inflata]